MNKKGNAALIITGVALGVTLLFLLMKLAINKHYSSRIPEISESLLLTLPVKEQLSVALEQAIRKPSADNLGKAGMAYHSSANYEQAAQCYELAIKRDRSKWIWNYYLGFLHMEMGDSQSVIENFSTVVEKNPTAFHAWYYIGQEQKNLRKNEQAEQSFRKIITILNRDPGRGKLTRYDYFPLGTYAMFQLARIYYDSERMDLAENTLLEIIQHNRSFGPAYRLLGNVYRVQGETVLSDKYSIRANDLVVFSPPVDSLIDRLVLLSRSELYLLKKIDEAEKSIYPEWAMQLVSRAIQYIPDNKYLISKAIRICFMSGADEQAVALSDLNIRDFQENYTEMNNMGTLFFQNGFYPQSMKYFTRALELKPDDAEIQNCMAICLWTAGEKDESIKLLNRILENNQDNPDILADATSVLFDLGQEEIASGHLTRLEQIAPEHPKVQMMSARIAEKNGNYHEAITLYNSSFLGDPEDLTTIRYLGTLLVRQKHWDKAIRHYRKALDHHPNDPNLLERLGTLLVTCPDSSFRDIGEGKEYAERAFIHTASRSLVLISSGRSLALAYAALGDKQNASSIIDMTLNIARRENISSKYVSDLMNLRSQL